MTTRKSFIHGMASVAALGLPQFARCESPAAPAPDVYPTWRPGELELHFIYTGCGENCFYILPDGTSILNDTGDFYRPSDIADIPLLPSAERLGGEWVSRYLSRVYPEKTIDYLMFSHWHTDHVGAADIGQKTTPKTGWRYRRFRDGTSGNGFRCVAEDFAFRRYLDHQYPTWGTYNTHDRMSVALVKPWLEAEREKGLLAEKFKAGALDQIAMLHEPEKYKGAFSIRNLCANGVAWDGADGVRDYAAEHVKATGEDRIKQNTLSSAFLIRYGKFSYYAGGDVCGRLKCADGSEVDYEEVVGRLAQSVTVCKMNHHGFWDAMSEGFVRSVRAKAYISCVWSPGQVNSKTLERMTSRELHAGLSPLVVPNLVPKSCVKKYEGRPFMANIPQEARNGVHVAVKVAPGGDSCRMYLLDARDESMRVLRTFDL